MQANRQTGRQADRQTERQENRKKEKWISGETGTERQMKLSCNFRNSGKYGTRDNDTNSGRNNLLIPWKFVIFRKEKKLTKHSI